MTFGIDVFRIARMNPNPYAEYLKKAEARREEIRELAKQVGVREAAKRYDLSVQRV